MPERLRILFFSNGIFILAGNLLVPLYSVYLQGFDNSVFSITLVWSVFLTASTLFTFIIGQWGKRFLPDPEQMLLAGYLLRAVAWASLMHVSTMPALLAVQIVLGLGEALGSPSFDAIFAERSAGERQLQHYSRWKTVSNLFTALGTFLGGVIVMRFGFNALFATMTFLGVASYLSILISRWYVSRQEESRLSMPFDFAEEE
jgi:MFS family permease